MLTHYAFLNAMTDDGRAAGSAKLRHINDTEEWELTDLHVYPSFRRRGIGNWLMNVICNDADKEGVTLCLTVGSGDSQFSNDALKEWYERHGFRGTLGLMARAPKRVVQVA